MEEVKYLLRDFCDPWFKMYGSREELLKEAQKKEKIYKGLYYHDLHDCRVDVECDDKKKEIRVIPVLPLKN